MSHFQFKICIRQGRNLIFTQTPKLHLLRSSYHPSAESFSSNAGDDSFTVSYLADIFGFTLESALSASKYIRFHSAEKPDSFIDLFKKYGWSQTEISALVRKNPQLLSYSVENILPKLEFLKSKGATAQDVYAIVGRNNQMLGRSLQGHIIPIYDFIRSLVRSDEKTRTTLKRGANIFNHDLESNLAFNVSLLRENGVPEANIGWLLFHQPQAMVYVGKLGKSVEQVKEIGINPSKVTFVVALRTLIGMTRSTWERKVSLYKKWGWTEEEVMGMFKKYPHCMTGSESKITSLLGFFVNELGWEPSLVGKYPGLFSLSLTKRVIPRDTIIQCLLSKGLLGKKSYLPGVFLCTEEQFLKRYVNCHEDATVVVAIREKISQVNTVATSKQLNVEATGPLNVYQG